MAYTTINKPSDYFNTVLYTGNGSTQSITGVNFQPDLVWIKNRGSAYSHQLYDVLRGATKRIFSDTTQAEGTDANTSTSFDSDGFSLGTNVGVNENGVNQVAWSWLANGAGSSNTDGSISATVSANTTSGFSIVKYTATGSVSTIGHGLGAVPSLIIVKNTSQAIDWVVYHSALGATKNIRINTTDAVDTSSSIWNNTEPTSSVFTVGTTALSNGTGNNLIAYCFAEVKGFSKFGSYDGNGSADGPFVYTGFKPAMIIVKHYNGAGEHWSIFDNKRLGYNPAHNRLYPNLSNVEATETKLDFVSNGFKVRASGDGHLNGSGYSYIYMAFAQHPIVSSSGTPCTAR